jgi:hypothetical protein
MTLVELRDRLNELLVNTPEEAPVFMDTSGLWIPVQDVKVEGSSPEQLEISLKG